MQTVHQEFGFDFAIAGEDSDPPRLHVTGEGGKYLLILIGVPGTTVPLIKKYENVDQDETNRVWQTVMDHQENFLIAWNRIHGIGEKSPRGSLPEKARKCPSRRPREAPRKSHQQSPRKKHSDADKAATPSRLRLKPRLNVEEAKELIGGISDRRFLGLQRKLIRDLDAAGFKTIDMGLFLRLGCWSNTGGSYSSAMTEVRALCKTLFGYHLPEKVGRIEMKTFRYRSPSGLSEIAKTIGDFHESKLGKG